MPELVHIPQFKLGQTVLSPAYCEADAQFVVVFTYRILSKYSPCYREVPADYNERDSSHTIYCCVEVKGGNSYIEAHWLLEPNMQLYCSNCERGKKILREPRYIQMLSEWYAIHDDSLNKLIATLNEPSSET